MRCFFFSWFTWKKYVEFLRRMARITKDNILFLNEGWLKSKKSRHVSVQEDSFGDVDLKIAGGSGGRRFSG